MLWTVPRAPRCKPRPPEMLWSLRRTGHHTDCVLQGVGEDGWDLSLRRDGAEFYGHVWVTRTLALEDAAEVRRNLERDGWMLLTRRPPGFE